jgi:hypothetical protein
MGIIPLLQIPTRRTGADIRRGGRRRTDPPAVKT